MSAEGSAQNGCTTCLAQMDMSKSPPAVAPASQPEISFLTGTPLLQANSTGEHVFFLFRGRRSDRRVECFHAWRIPNADGERLSSGSHRFCGRKRLRQARKLSDSGSRRRLDFVRSQRKGRTRKYSGPRGSARRRNASVRSTSPMFLS